jgi:hypothetical protein
VSYSLAIADGDLAKRGSQMALVFGVNKLKQDMNCWLLEQYGGDRFHTNMGSVLREFIGGVVSGSTRAEVEAEIMRVLENYQAMQVRRFKENPQKFSPSELLVSVDSVDVTVDYSVVRATVRVRNGSNEATTINVASGQADMRNPAFRPRTYK